MKINKNLFVQQGILDCQIDQLINYSHTDSQIKKFTSDSVRFKDLSSFNQWLAQGRIIYTLSDKNHNLLGIIWFGQKNPPFDVQANFTFAIRTYASARGRGLSFEFMKIAFADLFRHQKSTQITGIWLVTRADNHSAVHLYQKFGFKIVDYSENQLIMVL